MDRISAAKSQAAARSSKKQPEGNRKSNHEGSDQTEDLTRHQMDFLTFFGHLNDRLINHFSCACQGESDIILHHGRLFITERYICFSSHIIKEQLKIIPFSEVTSIVKKNTAILFSNAIGITHLKGAEFFTTFSHRDTVFDFLVTLWNKAKGEQTTGINLKTLIKQDQDAPKQDVNKDTKPDKDSTNSNTNLRPGSQPASTSGSSNNTSPSGSGIHHSSDAISRQSTTARDIDVFDNEKARNRFITGQISPPDRIRSATLSRSDSDESDTKNKPLDLAVLHSGQRLKKEKIKKSDKSEIPANVAKEIENEKKKTKSASDPQNNVDNNENAANSEQDAANSEQKQENEAAEEAEDDNVIYPSGNFADHITMPNDVCIDEVFPNVTIKEFYAKLLYDADFWEHIFVVTDNLKVKIPPFEPSDNPACLKRLCTFIAPIKGAPMGPKQTRVEQTHRISLPSEDKIVFDTSNFSLDIPYSDAFLIESVWVVTKEGTGCRLQIRWRARFLKSVWVKSLIEKGAKSATEEFYKSWVKEAHKVLSRKGKAPLGKKLSEATRPMENDAADKSDDLLTRSRTMVGLPLPVDEEVATTTIPTITIPLVGIDVTVYKLTVILAVLLFVFGYSYFFIRVHSLQSDIDQWKIAHQAVEDRLIFLQTYAAHVALNNSKTFAENSKLNERAVRALDWQLIECQDDVKKLQQTLTQTLQGASSVLEFSSSKKLGFSSNDIHDFQFSNNNYYDLFGAVILEEDASSWSVWTILLAIIAVVGIGAGITWFTRTKTVAT